MFIKRTFCMEFLTWTRWCVFCEINQSKPFEFKLMLSNQKVSELIERLDFKHKKFL